MILENKIILIMGIRNKWSIAYGAAIKAHEQGAKLCFSFMGEENRKKTEDLVKDLGNSKCYECDVSSDENIERLFKSIKKDYGKIDGIVHAIAHANTDDLHTDFINTSREGFSHANDISSYSLVACARYAKNEDVLNDGASIVTLTYLGSQKVLLGYNVMGVAKASLESSVRYLAQNLGSNGIRVNAVSAGPIKTLSSKGIKDFDVAKTKAKEKAPIQKDVTKEDVGDTVTFMLSDMSKAITGQVLYVDNGYSIMGT